MRKPVLVLVASVSMVTAGVLLAQSVSQFKVILSGYEEPPSVSTTGSGAFEAQIDKTETEITWELSYADLEGNVTQAHIHLGQRGVNGGISVFLCTNLGNGPPGTQPCPPSPATISGTIRASDIIGPTSQGLAPGELAELIRAIRAGATYVNVHSSKHPGGEIRSQFGKPPHEDRDH